MSVATGAPVEAGPPLVRIPTDVEYEERVWGPLTVRQAAALAVTGGVLYAGWWLSRGWLPTLAFLPAAAAVAALVLVVITARRDGQSLDRWLLAALTHQASTGPVEHPITGQAPAWLAAHAAPLDPHPGPGAPTGGGEPMRKPRRTPRWPPRTIHLANAVSTMGVAG